MDICPKCYEKMRDCTCQLTAKVEAEARRSAAACSRNDVPRTTAFHGRVKGTPLERYWSAIGELEKSERMLRKLRDAMDDFNGHGMPGFRDRAEAIVVMQMVDEFLSENTKDIPHKSE